MKYVMPYDKLEKLVFRYLNMEYNDLELRKPKIFGGYILQKSDYNTEIGSIGYEMRSKRLLVRLDLVIEISETFSISNQGAMSIIASWVHKKYGWNIKLLDWVLTVNDRNNILAIK